MSEIRRYGRDGISGEYIVARPDGQWVEYKDHAKAIEAKDAEIVHVAGNANTLNERLNEAERTVAKLQGMLAECYRLTGADADGNEDWRLAQRAMDEVRRLRRESDAAEARIAGLVRLITAGNQQIHEIASALGCLPLFSSIRLHVAAVLDVVQGLHDDNERLRSTVAEKAPGK
jgi:DNA repair exonuclease SbcCD ATPase subunit